MMQQLRAWLLSLGIALLLVIVVRSFAFAIYRVPAASVLRQGDRVMVNMLAHGNYKRGQLIVFGTKEKHLGLIKRRKTLTRILDRLHSIIRRFSWE